MTSTSLKLNTGICHFTNGCYGYGIIGLIVAMAIRGYCAGGIVVRVLVSYTPYKFLRLTCRFHWLNEIKGFHLQGSYNIITFIM